MKLSDEIAKRTVGVTKATRHLGQWLPLHDHGAEGLVTSLQRRLRIEEELSAIHDLPPIVTQFLGGNGAENRTVKSPAPASPMGRDAFGRGNVLAKRTRRPKRAE